MIVSHCVGVWKDPRLEFKFAADSLNSLNRLFVPKIGLTDAPTLFELLSLLN